MEALLIFRYFGAKFMDDYGVSVPIDKREWLFFCNVSGIFLLMIASLDPLAAFSCFTGTNRWFSSIFGEIC